MQLCRHVSVSELANTEDLLQGSSYVVLPCYKAYFWNLLIAVLDPFDRVQPRSKTSCVGWWESSRGTEAIQAKCLELYHAVFEDSSEQLEYQSPDSEG